MTHHDNMHSIVKILAALAPHCRITATATGGGVVASIRTSRADLEVPVRRAVAAALNIDPEHVKTRRTLSRITAWTEAPSRVERK